MHIDKIIPGNHDQEIIDQCMEAAVVPLVVVKSKVHRKDGPSRTVVRFFTQEGDLVAVTDPEKESDYHK